MKHTRMLNALIEISMNNLQLLFEQLNIGTVV